MKAEFLLSTLKDFPNLKDPKGKPLPEIAIAGRSNVGKSSLINHLLGKQKVARISAKPGKTRLLNFFLIDEAFLFVDLPGYGFAKAPKKEIEEWSNAIDHYLNNRSNLKMIFLLIDSRRDIQELDESIIDWAEEKEIPLLCIFTKTDKLSRSELMALQNKYSDAIFYTTSNTKGRHAIEKKIAELL